MIPTPPTDPDEVRRILEERAEALARPPEAEEDAEMLGVLTLAVGSERYGVPLDEIVGIEPLVNVAAVPNLPLLWAGLANVRGRLCPVLDLAKYLGVSPDARHGQRNAVVVASGPVTVGLLADEVSDVTWIRRTDIGPPPPGARSAHAGLRGVTPDLLAVLDVEALLGDPLLVVDHEPS